MVLLSLRVALVEAWSKGDRISLVFRTLGLASLSLSQMTHLNILLVKGLRRVLKRLVLLGLEEEKSGPKVLLGLGGKSWLDLVVEESKFSHAELKLD